MLSPSFKKIFRDLWNNKGRSILVILAITIGVVGVGGILFAYSILLRELDKNYMMTNPASASLYVNKIDDKLLKKIKDLSEIKTVEARGFYEGRIEVSDNTWKSIWLFVINDFKNQKLNKFKKDSGSFFPKRGEILLERMALNVAEARIGDEKYIIIPGFEKVSLKITGAVHDPGEAPAWMENLVYGYITLDTLHLLGKSYLNELNIIVQNNYFEHNHVKKITQSIVNRIEGNGYEVTKVVIPRPGKHPHATQLSTLLFLLQSFGLLSLILSSILIVNLVSSMLTQQIRQIGIMKAIGATTLQIIKIYISKVIIMASIGIIIAFPLAILMAKSYSIFAAYMLNFEIMDNSIPMLVYLTVVFIGLFIPIISSLLPIFKGSKITVKDAITDYGISLKKVLKRKPLLIKKNSFFTRPIVLSIRNTFRKKSRLILTFSTLAVGGMIFMSSLNTGASISKTINTLEQISRFNFNIKLKKPVTENKLSQTINTIANVENYEGWGLIKGNIINENGFSGNELEFFAVKNNTKQINPIVRKGRWLNNNDTTKIVVNHMFFIFNPEYSIGDDIVIKIDNKLFIFQIIGSTTRVSPSVAYINYDYFSKITNTENLVSNVTIKTSFNTLEKQKNVMKDIEKAFFNNSVIISSSMMLKEFTRILEDHYLIIVIFLMLMSILTILVGGLGLVITMSIQVIERTREIGILRAIGASNYSIIKSIIIEGFLIGLISWVLAIAVSIPSSMLISYFIGMIFFDLPLFFAINPLSMFIWLGIIIIFSIAASFIPAFKAVKLTVKDTLAYE